jgi:hypothetical protein
LCRCSGGKLPHFRSEDAPPLDESVGQIAGHPLFGQPGAGFVREPVEHVESVVVVA